MPELPEVEIAARNLRRWAEGRRIERAEAEPGARRIFRPDGPREVALALAGRRIASVRRVGKHLLVTLEDGDRPLGLHAHLGMTGKWVRREPGEPPPRHSRARLFLEGGAVLHFNDSRLFGRLHLVDGARFGEVPEIAALGPDPLEEGIDLPRLAAALARTRRPVKVALLDQALLPGVGNIHASEACFRARIDPRRRASSLSRAEVRRLAGAVMASLKEVILREDGPEIVYVEEPGAENPFLVYAREGEACPRCPRSRSGGGLRAPPGLIRRIVQAQRSTFFCPRCQGRAG